MPTLYDLVVKHNVPIDLTSKDGLALVVKENSLQPGDEDEFLKFLNELAKAVPSVSGELEVWWPMAIESGPQLWKLAAGKLLITESDIVWAEPQAYKE